MSNIRLTLANNIDFDESYSHVKILVHPSVFFVVSYHFANARRIFLIFREVLQISYFFVENFTEFYRATFRSHVFHFHITLFKQILKPELREIPDNPPKPLYFAQIPKIF